MKRRERVARHVLQPSTVTRTLSSMRTPPNGRNQSTVPVDVILRLRAAQVFKQHVDNVNTRLDSQHHVRFERAGQPQERVATWRIDRGAGLVSRKPPTSCTCTPSRWPRPCGKKAELTPVASKASGSPWQALLLRALQRESGGFRHAVRGSRRPPAQCRDLQVCIHAFDELREAGAVRIGARDIRRVAMYLAPASIRNERIHWVVPCPCRCSGARRWSLSATMFE